MGGSKGGGSRGGRSGGGGGGGLSSQISEAVNNLRETGLNMYSNYDSTALRKQIPTIEKSLSTLKGLNLSGRSERAIGEINKRINNMESQLKALDRLSTLREKAEKVSGNFRG